MNGDPTDPAAPPASGATRPGEPARPAPAVTAWPLVWRVLVLAGLGAASYWFVRAVAVRRGFFDLKVYYGAINYWVHDGATIYDYLLPKSTYGFTYPPFAALVMSPMAVMPWQLVLVISSVACVIASVVVLHWLMDPVIRRQGWRRWFVLGIAVCLAVSFEPLRETYLFGQVNMLLVFLVAADVVLLVSRGSAWGGIGIGLATAIKLTPGIFILYLLVTKRFRAAAVASVTAIVATVVAAALAPDASRVFWTDALWNTDRVGTLAFISNQSLNGAVARLNPSDPNGMLWLSVVAAVLMVWALRVRRAIAAGDELAGFALTGIVGCLASPITWVHHLVWVGPALVLMFDRAVSSPRPPHRVALSALLIAGYALLSSRLVWEYHNQFDTPRDWFLSNAYVWASIVLLVALPIRADRVVAPVRASAAVS